MHEYSTPQNFRQELQLFFEKNEREFWEILQLIPNFNFRSYPIELGSELMETIGDFLAAYQSQNAELACDRHQEKTIKLFPIDNTSVAEIEPKNKKFQKAESLWQYHPISNAQPENHTENHALQAIADDNSWQLLGASVRGKSHKHKGTNRDDWFEFRTLGRWQIIAVADGAGSKTFSRLGAKISCRTAVEEIEKHLSSHQLESRQSIEELKQSDRQDVDFVYQAIAKGIVAAYRAVSNKAEELQDSVTYYEALDRRRLKLSDLAATLLIAIRTTITIGKEEYSFVFSHQIGDGIIAAISQQNHLHILGIPDSGNYAGQTSFLTSEDRDNEELIVGNIKTFIGNLKTLMVMSDGVSDDYFPNSPKILSLYGDLVLNQILTSPHTISDINKICLDRQKYIAEKQNNFCHQHRVLTMQGEKIFPVAYLHELATLLEIEEQKLIRSPLLGIGAKANLVEEIYSENIAPAEKLCNWLDAYYRQGSFDDRTLVILHQQ